jgi:hypothetical protein
VCFIDFVILCAVLFFECCVLSCVMCVILCSVLLYHHYRRVQYPFAVKINNNNNKIIKITVTLELKLLLIIERNLIYYDALQMIISNREN